MWSALCCKWCLSLRMLRRHNRFRRFFAVIGCLCLLIVILLAVQQPIICDSLSTIKENIQYNSTKCKGVHVAFSCQQTEDVREAIHMLTSLLYFRSNHVTLYIFATPVTQNILQTVFTTWDVGQLEVNYYNTKIGQTFTDHVHLLNHRVLVKVLFVSVKVRFLSDITPYFLANHEDTKSTFIQSSPITMTTYFTDSVIHIQPLGCTWVYTSQCPSTVGFPQAIFRSSSASCITRSIGRSNPCLCAMLEELTHLDPHRFRDLSFQSACLSKQFTPAKLFYKNNICWRFYRSTALTYMTHIYYYSTGRDITPFGAIDEVTPAITMVTILTMSRFEVFVRTVSHWNGPVIAVVYGSPQEIHTLIPNISSSTISSFDVIYHVVYDNEEFVPLNYLRNIGLNSSTTMYTIYNDVDLVPVPNLHDTLVRKIPTWNQMATDTGEKYAFIVPCFNAADPISKSDFPKNQVELITLWNNDTVDDWVKWPFGHSIVDYMRWKFSTESYEVYYEHHSEPYLVLQTSSMPTYDVMVPDGMRDKIQYTLVLYAQNYHFMVVEEVFLLHLPHKFSRSREVFSNGPVTFNQCIMSIYIDFVQKLVKQYPEMIVPRKVLNEIRFHRSLVNARAHGHLPTINEISRFMWMNLRNEISDDKEWY